MGLTRLPTGIEKLLALGTQSSPWSTESQMEHFRKVPFSGIFPKSVVLIWVQEVQLFSMTAFSSLWKCTLKTLGKFTWTTEAPSL